MTVPHGESLAPGPHSQVDSSAPPDEHPPQRHLQSRRGPPRPRTALILFLLTCVTTIFAGVGQFPAPKTAIDSATGKEIPIKILDRETRRESYVFDRRGTLLNGLTYAIAVLVMLGAHEAGHYLQARRYKVPASLPLFIPMPIGPLGTMGAVIFQQPGVADRKSMFDIAISGPLAGLAIALPLNWWGIRHSEIITIQPGSAGWTNPRLVEWMIAWIHRPLLPGEDIALNPILFAGWVGIFITALNMVPIGQLDGGHILYCLVGKKAHSIARTLYFGFVAFVILQILQGHAEYSAWSLMLILVWFMGTRHPPTANDDVPLGLTRIVLGWLTLAFILVGFVSSPQYVNPPPEKKPATIHDAPEVAR